MDNGTMISRTEHLFISGHSVTEHLEPSWKTSFSILFGIISFLATMANLVVLKTLHRFRELQTTSNKILAALAIADMVTGVVVGPINVLQLLNKDLQLVTYIYNIRTYLSTILILTSDYITAFISLDRCLHIRKLLNYSMKHRTLYVTLTLCWLVPVASSSVLLINGPTLVMVYIVNAEVLATLIILITFYTTLIVALHRFTARNESLKDDAYLRKQSIATRTVLVIITAYIVMKIPVLISFIFIVMDRGSLTFRAKFYAISNLICVSNSFVNPMLYGYRTLRKHIKKLFPLDDWCLNLKDKLSSPAMPKLTPFVIHDRQDTKM